MINKTSVAVLARAGYAARGAVYILVGGICIASALSGFGQEQSPKGALSLLTDQPFGSLLLIFLALCLFGFFAWRMMQALLNADDHDEDVKGWTARIACFVSGVTYGALGVSALRVGLTHVKDNSNGSESVAAELMRHSFGHYLVGALGLVIIGVGCAQIWRGLAGTYEKWLEVPPSRMVWVRMVCGFGLSVRGVLFIIAGGLFAYAAMTVDPGQAGSMADALDWLRQLPFGLWLYFAAALGLLAFGLYSLIEAAFRRVSQNR